jgi:thymidylate kinase/predicted nucleotidyltransferase
MNLLIHLAGVDGSGKTTQALRLLEAFEVRGLSASFAWVRFPRLFSIPFLVYARLRRYSWRETVNGVEHGYWDFRRSPLMTVVFPWALWIDTFLMALIKVYLPLLSGRVVVCDRFVVDILADLMIALDDRNFARRLPGRLFLALLPRSSRVVVLDIETSLARQRSPDLEGDKTHARRREIYLVLAESQRWPVVSSAQTLEATAGQLQHLTMPEKIKDLPGIEKEKNSVYAKVDSPWMQRIVRQKSGALFVHWLFQGLFYMDPTERRVKLGLNLILTLLFGSLFKTRLPSLPAFGLGLITAHTLNFLFNGQIFGVLKHFGGVRHTWEEFNSEVERMRSVIAKEPDIVYAAAYGSLARSQWSPTSDLDLRLVRAPGLRSAIRTSWFAIRERARANFKRFPLDLYVLDSYDSLMRMSEKDPIEFTNKTKWTSKNEGQKKESRKNELPKGGSKRNEKSLKAQAFDTDVQEESMVSENSQSRTAVISKFHWVLFYLASTLWFLAFTAANQRNYQDTWILEGIAVPFIALLGVFVIVVIRQTDNRVVALLVAWTSVVIVLIPPLKYVQPYSTTIDATDHYLLVQNIMETGRVIARHTYASIPAFHSWLASFGLFAGINPEQVIRFALPLTASVMPVMIYFVCLRAGMPHSLTKYTILASILSLYGYYQPNGTGFTLIPLITLLSLVAVQAYQRTPPNRRHIYVTLALIGLFAKIFWHSTTPLILPAILFVAAFTPMVLFWINPTLGKPKPSFSIMGFAFLSAILFISYHLLQRNYLGEMILGNILSLTSPREAGPPSVPNRVFEISTMDVLVMSIIMHAREILVLALSFLGLAVIWTRRKTWGDFLHFYAYFGLVMAFFITLVGIVVVGGIAYQRFLLLVIAVSPFFSGAALWWLSGKVSNLKLIKTDVRLPAAIGLSAIIMGMWLVDFYPYQPMVPLAKALAPGAADEYLLWVHSVNTAYQKRMMNFAEENASAEARFAVDIAGHRQFRRYFGMDAGLRRGLYAPLFRKEHVDPTKVDLFLLHWPGQAGAMSEQVEYRSAVKLKELRDMPGWGLVYDNGESFILLVRDNTPQASGP